VTVTDKSPRVLTFNPVHWETVLSSGKTATTRFDEPVEVGPAMFVFEFEDDPRTLPGYVDSIETLPLGDVTDKQASSECLTADELRQLLRSFYYPGITDDDLVQFVRFHVVASVEEAG
jgi:cytidine deaminase